MVVGGVQFRHASTVPLPLAGGRGIARATLGYASVPTRVPFPRHVRVVAVSHGIPCMIPTISIVVVVVRTVVVMVVVVVVVRVVVPAPAPAVVTPVAP